MRYLSAFLGMACIAFFSSASIAAERESCKLSENYSAIVEKLILYKNDAFTVFYGGPITKHNGGTHWLMPIKFQDESYNTRALYEVMFVNCDPQTANDAEVLFIDVADIDIKFKNTITADYAVFSHLASIRDPGRKCVLVRAVDVGMIYYPDFFVASVGGIKKKSDRDAIVQFLHEKYNTQSLGVEVYQGGVSEPVQFEDAESIVYEPRVVNIKFGSESYNFVVEKRILKNDQWQLYYVISLKNAMEEKAADETVFLRIDSGCTSGQVYGDDACDCLEQLHAALLNVAREGRGMIIHIPFHDGRGFGTAPKAETEIYKIGGNGRVHATQALNTVAAAQLLYGDQAYDLRSYGGVAKIIRSLGFQKVELFTDNVHKVEALSSLGIQVRRRKTETSKASCKSHLEAKFNSGHYYKN